MLTPEWDVRAYKPVGSAWQRIDFPSRKISSLQWENLISGGYGTGRVVLETPWENYQLTGNERVDIYLNGVLAYRGLARMTENNLEEEQNKVVNLYGLIGLVGKPINTRYAYPAPVDISVIAQDLFNDYVLPYDPNAIANLSTTGITLAMFDAVGKTFKQAMDDLLSFGPTLGSWQWDAALSGGVYQNRLNLNPTLPAVQYVWPVGGNIKAALYPSDSNAIVNTMKILGGMVSQPNLVNNGDFEHPASPDVNHGNLLGNAGFELGTEATASPWNLTSGASVKGTSDPGSGLNGAHSGSNWLALDQNNEAASQTVPIDFTLPLSMSLWVRNGQEVSPGGIFSAFVDGLDAGGAVVSTVTVASAVSIPLIPGYIDGIYSEVGPTTVDFSAHPTVTQAKVRVVGGNGTDSGDGTAVDDVALYYRDVAVQNAWVSLPVACTASAVNWLQKVNTPGDSTAPLEGSYCVRVTCTPTTGGYTEIRTAPWARISLKSQRIYSLMLAARTKEGSGDNFDISMGVTLFNSDGTVYGDYESVAYSGGSDDAWHVLSFLSTNSTAIATPNSELSAEIYIRVRSSVVTYIDGVMMVEGPPPLEYVNDHNYWPADQYTKTYDVTSADLTLATGINTSISTWGVREAFVDQPLVVDKASAIAYANGYLNKHATPDVRGRITLVNWVADAVAGSHRGELINNFQKIRLTNLPLAPAALTPSRIQYTVEDDVQVDVDVEDDRPDLALLLQNIQARNQPPAPASGSSSAGYTPYNANGSSGSGAPVDANLVHLAGTETITGAKTFTQPILAQGGYESSDGTAGATTSITPAALGSKIADPTTALALTLTTGLGGTFKSGDIVNLFYSWRTAGGYRTNVNTLATITITADNQSVSTTQPATIPAGATIFDLWVQGSPMAGGEFPPKLFAPGLAASAGAAVNVLEYTSGGIGPPGENTTPLEGAGAGTAITVKDGLIT
jgi:hypothetical protein